MFRVECPLVNLIIFSQRESSVSSQLNIIWIFTTKAIAYINQSRIVNKFIIENQQVVMVEILSAPQENDDERQQRLDTEKENADRVFREQLTIQKELKEFGEFKDDHFTVQY